MPSTVGRVPMPHNNRMSTSNSLRTNEMWSTTIGHDPYAAAGEAGRRAEEASRIERSKDIMELARLNNVDQGLGDRGTNFAQALFWGLKRKAPPEGYETLSIPENDDDDHDEEGEASYISSRLVKDKRKKRSLDHASSSSSSSTSSDHKKKHKKKKKKKRRRQHHHDASASSLHHKKKRHKR